MTEAPRRELTELDRQILDFETAHPVWKYKGAKDSAILDLFQLDPIRYAQLLNHLLDAPPALAYAPQTVARLRRIRDQRRARRTRPLAG